MIEILAALGLGVLVGAVAMGIIKESD